MKPHWMYNYNYNEGHQDFKNLVNQYEKMLAEGVVAFLEPESFEHIIDYYEEENKLQKALAVVENALTQHTYTAIFYIRKAQLLIEESRFEDAEESLDMALIYEPSNLDILLTKADLYMQKLMPEKASEILQQAKTFADEDDMDDIYILEATVYETQGFYAKAFDMLKKVVRADPFNDLALSRMWMNMELAEMYKEGIQFHLEIIDEAPYSYWAWFNLAHAYTQLEQYEKAVEAYDYAIVINDKFEYAYRDCINCLFGMEEYDQVLGYIEDYAEHFDLDAEILTVAGECHEYTEEYLKAREYYAKALQLEDLEGKVYYRLGVCYAHEGHWGKAREMFESAHKADRKNEEFCIALAEAFNQLDDLDKAHKYYYKAIEIAPELVTTWINYLEFLIDEESYAFALEILEDASEHCEDLELDYARAAILLESGARKEGLLVLGLALSKDATACKVLFQIAPDMKEDLEVLQFIIDHQGLE